MKLNVLLVPVAMAGMLAAQTATAPQANKPAAPHQHRHMQHSMLQRMTRRLNLTQDQQNKAKEIFAKARTERKAIGPKMREERAALFTAIKADNQGQIDRILQQNSQLNTQAMEIHTKAVAQFYQILNPAQKAQFDQMMNRRMNRGARPSVGESR